MAYTIKLVAPWVAFYREVEALFAEDPDVRVEYVAGDGEDPQVHVYVEGSDKAEALEELLPHERNFGALTVTLTVIPANERRVTRADLFRKAFDGNPALSFIATVEGVMTNPISYVVFRNKVVQYWNDDLGDVNGNCSTLMQEIAKDVFGGAEGIFFCTDTPENLGTPKGR